MPQLDPAPWFFMMSLSWTVLLAITLPKTLDHTFPNEPTINSALSSSTKPWTWGWS